MSYDPPPRRSRKASPPDPAPLGAGSCPRCRHPVSSVWMTRRRKGSTYRVRICARCGHRFRTSETLESAHSPGRVH